MEARARIKNIWRFPGVTKVLDVGANRGKRIQEYRPGHRWGKSRPWAIYKAWESFGLDFQGNHKRDLKFNSSLAG